MSGHSFCGHGSRVVMCAGIALICLHCSDGSSESTRSGPRLQSGSGGSGSTSSATGGAVGSGSATQSSGGNSTASGGSATGGSQQAGGAPNNEWPDAACDELKLESNVSAANSNVDRFTYQDSLCNARTAAMARLGKGYVRQVSYQLEGGATRTVTGTGSNGNGYAGFGYTSNHKLPRDGQSEGAYKPVFVGRHHAIYEYKFDVSSNLPVTIQWLLATGRDHPLIAITYDMTETDPGIGADTRTPYGDMAWDGDDNKGKTVVSGLGWGDRYKFITTKAPLTKNSSWDYTEKNLVPYVIEWTESPNAEMGLVQTQTWEQKDAGGYWHYNNWGKTSDNQTRADGQVGLMPATFNWTYQLNQYELCPTGSDNGCDINRTTGSHRMAWGANYGAIGGKGADGKYPAYGDDKQLSGYPYQSYSVFMVLGEHTKAPVFAQVAEVEAIQSTKLTASVGKVAAMVPGGVARTDLVTAQPPGYDHRFAAWSIEAEQNRAAFKLNVEKGALTSPMFIVSAFAGTAPANVVVDGATLRADVDYFMSADPDSKQLWLTLRGRFTGSHEIALE